MDQSALSMRFATVVSAHAHLELVTASLLNAPQSTTAAVAPSIAVNANHLTSAKILNVSAVPSPMSVPIAVESFMTVVSMSIAHTVSSLSLVCSINPRV